MDDRTSDYDYYILIGALLGNSPRGKMWLAGGVPLNHLATPEGGMCVDI